MSPHPSLPNVLPAARGYVAGELSVIPMQAGTKDPEFDRLPLVWDAAEGRQKHKWAPYRDRLPYADELNHWFGDGQCNVAIVCGTISGGLVVLDLEHRWVFEQWLYSVLELVDEEVITSLLSANRRWGKLPSAFPTRVVACGDCLQQGAPHESYSRADLSRR